MPRTIRTRIVASFTMAVSIHGEPDETFCGTPRATTERLNGLNGSLSSITRAASGDECDATQAACDINASEDWDQIDAFVRTVRAPRCTQRPRCERRCGW